MLDSRKRRSFSALATVVLISLCVTIAHTALMAQSTASSAAKSKSWLDSNPAPNWNQPGQALPRPIVEDDSNLWRCGEQIRLTSKNKADQAVIAAGWKLIGPLHLFENVRVILGTSGFDGMCRPMGYQGFVFEGSKFAGTLAPAPMDSREDGDLSHLQFPKLASIVASYKRYRESDPRCCPSSSSYVEYKIETRDGMPVLTPVTVNTSSNPGTPPEKP
ncbi:MAG TPA: LppP/LprE family lipoprotein [Terriglobales bacterium]|nr:LppP/LprE family lipoprotein [Terriglobales bacterium]